MVRRKKENKEKAGLLEFIYVLKIFIFARVKFLCILRILLRAKWLGTSERRRRSRCDFECLNGKTGWYLVSPAQGFVVLVRWSWPWRVSQACPAVPLNRSCGAEV